MIKKIAILGIIALFTFLLIYCTTDEATIIGPFGDASKYITVANFSADKTLLYSKGDTAHVSIKILDVDNAPAIGLIVDFTTQFGSITEMCKTDSNGLAIATFISDNNTGENIITADTGVKKHTLALQIIDYEPKFIELFSDTPTLLADGISTTIITAVLKDSIGNPMPNIELKFETNLGTLSKEFKITNTEGLTSVNLTSSGNIIDKTAKVKAMVTALDTTIFETIEIVFRGITSITSIDSVKMADYGMYKAFIRTNLLETSSGDNISSGAVLFTSPIGIMEPPLVAIDELGTASSVFSTEILPVEQYNVVIESELSSAATVSSASAEFDISGAEMLINTVDDEVMGDGEGWALLKATLREINGKAITGTKIEWETTLGTIIGQSETNTSGHTIDTLRIENSVNQNTNVTIRANYGNNISITDIVTFIEPVNSNRLILGFEPDTTGHGIIWCNIDTALAVREVGISAQFVNSSGDGYEWQAINFSVVPNNFASICPIGIINAIGLANVMMVYPPQNAGEIVRVWAEAQDGTKGSIDVILPKDATAVD